MARKKSNTKFMIFGAIILGVVALGVLMFSGDTFDTLSTNDLVFNVPVNPNSLLPPSETQDFDPVSTSGTTVGTVECKLKQTTTVFYANGGTVEVQSSGTFGTPSNFQVNDITSLGGTSVLKYEVEPKAFCRIASGEPNIIFKDSTLQLRVTTQNYNEQLRVASGTVFTEIIRNLDTNNLVFSATECSFAGCIEKSFGKFVVTERELFGEVPNTDNTINVAFKLKGTMNMGYTDPVFSIYTFQYPVNLNDLVSNVQQKVNEETGLADTDGDGIPDVSDSCPTQAENYNGNRDLDGCPDTDPVDLPTAHQGDDTPDTINDSITQTQCSFLTKTWFISETSEFCGTDAPFKLDSEGNFCPVFNIDLNSCVGRGDPSIDTTQEPDSGSGFTTREEVATDLESGEIFTKVSLIFSDNTSETINVGGNLIESSAGALQTASILGDQASTQSQSVLREIVFESFYVRDTLTDAQAIKLVQSGIIYKPIMRLQGDNISLPTIDNPISSDVGQTGHTFDGNKFGVSLGKAVFSASSLQNEAFKTVSSGQSVKFTLSVTTEGVALLERAGISVPVQVSGETTTLSDLTVSNGITPVAKASCSSLGLVDGTDEFGNAKCLQPTEGDLQCASPFVRPDGFDCSEEYALKHCLPPSGTQTTYICTEPDTDLDSVFDYRDTCPTQKEDGLGANPNDGCPDNVNNNECTFGICIDNADNDQDTVSNKDDLCPDEFGLVSNNGCPSSSSNDSDGDGVPNDKDACPTQAGSPVTNGCPTRTNDPRITVDPDNPFNALNDPTTQLFLAIGIVIIGVAVVIIKKRS